MRCAMRVNGEIPDFGIRPNDSFEAVHRSKLHQHSSGAPSRARAPKIAQSAHSKPRTVVRLCVRVFVCDVSKVHMHALAKRRAGIILLDTVRSVPVRVLLVAGRKGRVSPASSSTSPTIACNISISCSISAHAFTRSNQIACSAPFGLSHTHTVLY